MEMLLDFLWYNPSEWYTHFINDLYTVFFALTIIIGLVCIIIWVTDFGLEYQNDLVFLNVRLIVLTGIFALYWTFLRAMLLSINQSDNNLFDDFIDDNMVYF